MARKSRWSEAPRAVADARKLFISKGKIASIVRPPIHQSWARSAALGVDPADLHAGHYSPVNDAEDDVFERIRGVLAGAAEAFHGEPVSIIFAAASGKVIHWHCPDRDLGRQLESVSLVPGVSYGEAQVGTNGIGTALELASPTLVVGEEHFNQRLSVFACAGAPLHHPVTGALLGVVDITCAADRANPLLLSTARSIASQLQDALLAQVSSTDMALLRDYLATSRESGGATVAFGNDLLILNRDAQALLGPDDRAALIDRSAESALDPTPRTFHADLPSGAVAQLRYEPTFHGGSVVGGVFRVEVDGPDSLSTQPDSPAPPVTLPGVVGMSPGWLAAVAQVCRHLAHQRTVILQGEPGVGKLALLKAVHYNAHGSLQVRVFDCAAVTDFDRWISLLWEELAGGVGTVVLQHLERLPAVAVAPLADALREHAATTSVDGPHWVVATQSITDRPNAIDTLIAPFFGATVTLPPLRRRPVDVPLLAQRFAESAAGPVEARFTPAALSLLAGLPWAGNVTELHDVVRKAVRTHVDGVIDVDQLPAECVSNPGRRLGVIESLERDAVVRSLRENTGDVRAAAASLDMSVALFEEKLLDFGVIPEAFAS